MIGRWLCNVSVSLSTGIPAAATCRTFLEADHCCEEVKENTHSALLGASTWSSNWSSKWSSATSLVSLVKFIVARHVGFDIELASTTFPRTLEAFLAGM